VVVGVLSMLALVVLGLSLSYVFLVVRDQPLVRGSVWRNPEIGVEVPGALPPDTAAHVIEYDDGASFTVDAWLRNDGRFALTVTRVEVEPPTWIGLARITDVRAGIFDAGDHCCAVDRQATWAASHFVPFILQPNEERPVVLRYMLGHCEDNDVGGSYVEEGLNVEYDVMGNGHTSAVPFGEPIALRYGKASECPRPPTHPMGRPALAPPRAPMPASSPPKTG
jgi:hypothetical protein